MLNNLETPNTLFFFLCEMEIYTQQTLMEHLQRTRCAEGVSVNKQRKSLPSWSLNASESGVWGVTDDG